MSHPTDKAVQDIFKAIDALAKNHPDHNWKNAGWVLGNAGEIWACEELGLTPAKIGTKSFDALTADGKRVQIKTTRSRSTVMRIKDIDIIDLLCVVRFSDDYNFSIEYFGDIPKDKFRFNQYVNAMDLPWTI